MLIPPQGWKSKMVGKQRYIVSPEGTIVTYHIMQINSM